MPRPDSDHVLIINSQLAAGDGATVLEDMAVYGCRFIFVGGHVETPYPAAIVHTPFTTDMIVRSIANAVPSRPESPPADHT
ncbi:hypothetical protein [Yoonia sp. 208BN28-4]|uniref:hypothetical protein n=1 Tax=Yoonia sp. 208BN28-4 TaxID=3126505 RepID=UPI0030B60CF7